jgi:hypothetical protein
MLSRKETKLLVAVKLIESLLMTNQSTFMLENALMENIKDAKIIGNTNN